MTLTRISIKEWESFPREPDKVLNGIYYGNVTLVLRKMRVDFQE